jgi:hypothetical protein
LVMLALLGGGGGGGGRVTRWRSPHASQQRTGQGYGWSRSLGPPEQLEQKSRPQQRQWCLRVPAEKLCGRGGWVGSPAQYRGGAGARRATRGVRRPRYASARTCFPTVLRGRTMRHVSQHLKCLSETQAGEDSPQRHACPPSSFASLIATRHERASASLRQRKRKRRWEPCPPSGTVCIASLGRHRTLGPGGRVHRTCNVNTRGSSCLSPRSMSLTKITPCACCQR